MLNAIWTSETLPLQDCKLSMARKICHMNKAFSAVRCCLCLRQTHLGEVALGEAEEAQSS